MNRINKKFEELRALKRAALIPYLPLGYPTIEISKRLINQVTAAGADIIELGFPFSDPVADGPVIQKATQLALKNGMTLSKALEIAKQSRQEGNSAPFIFMGYYNPILNYGLEEFACAARDAGIDGLIVPDLPPEESEPLRAACLKQEINLIFLAAPTSSLERLKIIANLTEGFLYLVSVLGVTGARDTISSDLHSLVDRARSVTTKPICVGFGIANSETARQVAAMADGVIVGSALVSQIGDPQDASQKAQCLIHELRSAL